MSRVGQKCKLSDSRNHFALTYPMKDSSGKTKEAQLKNKIKRNFFKSFQ